MGHRVKMRAFDNSTKDANRVSPTSKAKMGASSTRRSGPIPGSAAYARNHPINNTSPALPPASASGPTHPHKPPSPGEADVPQRSGLATLQADAPPAAMSVLRDALLTLSTRPPTPAAFVATIRVKHDAVCFHPVSSCPACSRGLVCCECGHLYTPAVARHLACKQCEHIAFSCCESVSCCKCNKLWLPTDAVIPPSVMRFRGGASSNTGASSSPKPDIWTPSPCSSPDEIDDLTARANVPLPTSRPGSESSRAPSRASSVDVPVDIAATPLPTPDFSALPDESIDGLLHPSFPDRAILDTTDKRHFLGRGDLSVTSLKLYARRIFTDTSHWITAGHFLADIFQGAVLKGSRDDFRRFVILVGTQLGYGDLAQSMSESLDVNRKMADEYMRLRDVASTWKQKAKDNAKSAKEGRKARDELNKAHDDIAAILEERKILIQQRREFLAKDDQLTTELNRVHKDYGNAIEDNAKFAANIEALEQRLALVNTDLASHLEPVPPPSISGHADPHIVECLPVVVVLPLGPLLGPRMLIRLLLSSPFFWPPP